MLPLCKAQVNRRCARGLIRGYAPGAAPHTGPMPNSPSSTALQVLLVAPSPSPLAEPLRGLCCELRHAADSEAMLASIERQPPQVLLFDGAGALDALRRLRLYSRLPAVVLVAGDAAVERVIALESGADDALAQPVVPRELVARLRAVQRRARPLAARERLLRFGAWQLDRHTRVLSVPGGPQVSLSLAEFRLLQVFLQHPGSVLSREQLMDLARGRSIDAFERSIDLLVSRLRSKLDDDPREPRHIRTVRGVGYLFDLFGLEPEAVAAAPMFPARYEVDKPR